MGRESKQPAIDVARLLAMCVSALIREGRGAEVEDAIRQGRAAAAALGPYGPDDDADDDDAAPSASALREKVLIDASGLLEAPHPIKLGR